MQEEDDSDDDEDDDEEDSDDQVWMGISISLYVRLWLGELN